MWKHDATPGPYSLRKVVHSSGREYFLIEVMLENSIAIPSALAETYQVDGRQSANAQLFASATALFDVLAEYVDWDDELFDHGNNCACTRCQCHHRAIAALKAAGGSEE